MKRLFGSSGVRGIANKELHPVVMIRLALAFSHQLNPSATVALAQDVRTTSDALAKAFTSGLLAGGVDVVSLGVVPTPALAYLTKSHQYAGGVMVTASHNPPQYNGVKIFNSNGVAITEEDCQRIEEDVARTSQEATTWSSSGELQRSDMLEEYLRMVCSAGQLSKRWKVVVDPGNGATSRVTPMILRNMGCDVVTINAHEDGHFPGRSPEPSGDALNILQNVVREVKGDIGIAHDSDGDRVVVVDEQGQETGTDQLLAAYAAHCVEACGGGQVVVNIDTSSCVDEFVRRAGGRIIRTRVGDAYIARQLVKSGGLFGGETSGAWIHPDKHYCPDGPLSCAKLLLALESKKCSASQFVSEVPTYATGRMKFECPTQEKEKAMISISTYLQAMSGVEETNELDGTRVSFEDNSWVLVRPSGTEPIIRVTAEARDKATLEHLLIKVEGVVRHAIKR